MLSGRDIADRLLQPENVSKSILLTPLGIVTLVSPLQLENAQLNMLVTLLGMLILFRFEQFANE